MIKEFQSTHPRRVWLYLSDLLRISMSFNPHTHEGCDIYLRYYDALWEFQSTHPRRVWQYFFTRHINKSSVSIHTPTKGVTLCMAIGEVHLMFQSTHPRRVWLLARYMLRSRSTFQSTHPRRVWHCNRCSAFNVRVFQSTHPRRVWPVQALRQATALQFQSTHPRRVWLGKDGLYMAAYEFQSTHPRRVWRIWFIQSIYYPSFNPHTHEGCDCSSMTKQTLIIGFNPHTHEGCDSLPSASLPERVVSIHTPTKGVTLYHRHPCLSELFQSTHPRRVWLE